MQLLIDAAEQALVVDVFVAEAHRARWRELFTRFDADRGNISISGQLERGHLVLRVADDGVGFDLSAGMVRRGLSTTTWLSPLARAKASAAGSFTWRSRCSCGIAWSRSRMCTPSAGKLNSGSTLE